MSSCSRRTGPPEGVDSLVASASPASGSSRVGSDRRRSPKEGLVPVLELSGLLCELAVCEEGE